MTASLIKKTINHKRNNRKNDLYLKIYIKRSIALTVIETKMM